MITKVMKNFRNNRVSRLFYGDHTTSYRSLRNMVTLSTAADVKFLPESTFKQFESYFDQVSQDVITNKLVAPQPRMNEHLKKIFDHNVSTGRKIRASLIIASYQIMQNGQDISVETMQQLFRFCWGFEMFFSAFIIQDDITDNTTLRRGKTAWHTEVGINAIDDSILLEAACDQLLRKYFGNHKNYLKMVEEYSDLRRLTRIGQRLDTFITSFDDFTLENYIDKTYYKMTSCTIHSPLRLSALLAYREDMLDSKEVVDVIKELGLIYCIMHDYLDCYGEKYFRKLGTDIQENTCTWPILVALQRANPEQRKALESCYGSYDESKIQKVKQIYDELKIYEAYETAESESYERIMKLMQKVPDREAQNLLNEIIKILYRK